MAKQRQTFGDRMAVLKNARHERFAQEVAAGKTQDEAYRLAGYKPSRQNASTLRTKQTVSDRIATIQASAATLTEMTVASITERLLSIADKGEGLQDAPGLSVARLSLMDAAKLNGLVVDKVQADVATRRAVPSRAELLAAQAQEAERFAEMTKPLGAETAH